MSRLGNADENAVVARGGPSRPSSRQDLRDVPGRRESDDRRECFGVPARRGSTAEGKVCAAADVVPSPRQERLRTLAITWPLIGRARRTPSAGDRNPRSIPEPRDPPSAFANFAASALRPLVGDATQRLGADGRDACSDDALEGCARSGRRRRTIPLNAEPNMHCRYALVAAGFGGGFKNPRREAHIWDN